MIAALDAVAAQAGTRLHVEAASLRDAVCGLRPVVSELARRAPRPRPERLSGLRDPRAPRHRALMEDDPLLNYVHRPLWQVRGEDRAGNDFVTGFSPPVPRWAGSPKENP